MPPRTCFCLRKLYQEEVLSSLQEASPDKPLLVIATGQYIGEGFDCPVLNTLFLTFPVSFKGKLTQYVGRVLRQYPGKERVTVYDYVDQRIAVLRKMYAKRRVIYRQLGFEAKPLTELGSQGEFDM